MFFYYISRVCFSHCPMGHHGTSDVILAVPSQNLSGISAVQSLRIYAIMKYSIMDIIWYHGRVTWNNRKIPFGKLSHNYGTSPFSMGKFAVSMVIFHSCVKLPEGIMKRLLFQCWMIFLVTFPASSTLAREASPFDPTWQWSNILWPPKGHFTKMEEATENPHVWYSCSTPQFINYL